MPDQLRRRPPRDDRMPAGLVQRPFILRFNPDSTGKASIGFDP